MPDVLSGPEEGSKLTTPNKQLAAKASEIAKGSDGMARTAANCVFVALGHSPSIATARQAIEAIELPDVRAASLKLLDELANDHDAASLS